jgi:hypothetical protein
VVVNSEVVGLAPGSIHVLVVPGDDPVDRRDDDEEDSAQAKKIRLRQEVMSIQLSEQLMHPKGNLQQLEVEINVQFYMYVCRRQGNQIGRIFAQCVIVLCRMKITELSQIFDQLFATVKIMH